MIQERQGSLWQAPVVSYCILLYDRERFQISMIQGGANIRAKPFVEVSPTASVAAMGVSGLDPGYVRLREPITDCCTGSQKPLSAEHTACYHYFIHGNKPRG